MNDNATKLIEQLAQKLGTTSEYLWGVLLKQAPIDATVTLIQSLAVIAFGIVLYKMHRKLMESDGTFRSLYGKYKELAGFPMIIGLLCFVFMAICTFFCIGDIINGYFNPEYWALDKIVHILHWRHHKRIF